MQKRVLARQHPFLHGLQLSVQKARFDGVTLTVQTYAFACSAGTL
jgi:hypothetical protein